MIGLRPGCPHPLSLSLRERGEQPFSLQEKGGDVADKLRSRTNIQELDSGGAAVIFYGSVGSFNYGHWLVDDFTRYAALERVDRPLLCLFSRLNDAIDRVRQEGVTLAAGSRACESRFVDPEIPVSIYELGLIYDLQVDANGNATLVRVWRGAGFGNLEKSHGNQASSAARRWSMSARKRWMNISALTCAAAAGASLWSSSRCCSAAIAAVSARAASSSSTCSAASLLASSKASRHSICCIKKAGGMAVLFSAWTGAPRSSHRYAARLSGSFRRW